MEYFSLFSGIGGFELGIEKALHNIEKTQTERNKKSRSNGSDIDREPRALRGSKPTTRIGIQKGYVESYKSKYKKKDTKCRHRMDIGWNNGEARCIGYSEINKYANEIYKKHFPEHKNYGDATQINTGELPDFDFLVAGFPCQTFSYAGERKGFDDARGTLFFEIARILRDKRPRYFLLENVKGLLSHDEGKTIQKMFGVLTDLRYQFEWQVLNSKDFGVPQSRERIFIIGYSGKERRPKIFPIRRKNGKNIEKPGEKIVSSVITNPYIIHNIYGGFKEEKPREFKEYSQTIRTPKGGGHIPNVIEGMQLRKLTPVECERLQGFPDNWTAGISDTQRYKCVGNAVTVNVIEAIYYNLVEFAVQMHSKCGAKNIMEVPNSSQG